MPATAQSPAVAAALLGVTGSPVPFDGGLACGSHGEVANDPTFGHRYSLYLAGNKPWDDESRYNLLHKYGDDNAKVWVAITLNLSLSLNLPLPLTLCQTMVWMGVALGASDQLRQRVAWALSQILVVAHVGVRQENKIEAW